MGMQIWHKWVLWWHIQSNIFKEGQGAEISGDYRTNITYIQQAQIFIITLITKDINTIETVIIIMME